MGEDKTPSWVSGPASSLHTARIKSTSDVFLSGMALHIFLVRDANPKGSMHRNDIVILFRRFCAISVKALRFEGLSYTASVPWDVQVYTT